jgi:hypothetical protein
VQGSNLRRLAELLGKQSTFFLRGVCASCVRRAFGATAFYRTESESTAHYRRPRETEEAVGDLSSESPTPIAGCGLGLVDSATGIEPASASSDIEENQAVTRQK